MSKREKAVNKLDGSQKKSILTRLLVAIPLIILALVAIIFGGWVIFGVSVLLLTLSLYEIVHSAGKKFGFWVWIITFLFGYLIAYYPMLLHSFSIYKSFNQPSISLIAIGLSLLAFFLMAILDKNFSFRDFAYLFLFTLIVGISFQCLLYLRFAAFSFISFSGIIDNAFKYGWSIATLLLVILVTALTDTFAYFGGMLFGKHKMCPRVSPKKTWEGFAFGFVGGMLVTAIILFVMALTNHPVLPILDLDHYWRLIIISVLLPLISTVGDLAFSLIKRGENIKDFSNLLPGHGGILDRLDSHLISCLGMTIILLIFLRGWFI